jgi:hypothetical protein
MNDQIQLKNSMTTILFFVINDHNNLRLEGVERKIDDHVQVNKSVSWSFVI